MKERTIQRQILIALSKEFRGRGIFWQNDTGTAKSMDGKRVIRFGLPGSSDILGCLDGRIICIEVKTATGRQSENQKKFQTGIEARGGFYAIARSADEAVEIVRNICGIH
mmetsp:Transcript_27250/g.49898  ORF Transcript_27250/g.49898 Transcript_27250/m.49898 type:complete len:110 (-) Transcript_27250:926-1255(-)